LAAKSFASAPHWPGIAARMGTASSEVAINTAISVPRVITFEPYRFAAMAENPH